MNVFRQMWDNEKTDAVSEAQINKSLSALMRRIGLYEKALKKRKRLKLASSFSKAAAILLLPLLATSIFLGVQYIRQKKELQVKSIEYSTLFGERKKLVLPDSSTVYLNSNSVLIAPERFMAEKREVFLIGEGFFTIAKAKNKPFVVHTNLVGIEALGTKFGVSSYPEDNAVSATLSEGSIRVNSLRDNSVTPVTLSPSQQLYYNSEMKGFKINKVDTNLYTSWKDGHLIFDNTPFAQVVEQIERRFGVHIKYNDYKLKDYGISAKFIQNQSIDEVLSVLGQIAYFKYDKEKDTIYII